MFSMYQGQLKITNLIRTTGVTGNATNYKNKQADNPICSTRDEISQPSRPISSRAATAQHLLGVNTRLTSVRCMLHLAHSPLKYQ